MDLIITSTTPSCKENRQGKKITLTKKKVVSFCRYSFIGNYSGIFSWYTNYHVSKIHTSTIHAMKMGKSEKDNNSATHILERHIIQGVPKKMCQ